MKCKACGKAARKTRVVMLLAQEGGCAPARVCQACERRGVTVVATFVPPVQRRPIDGEETFRVIVRQLAAYKGAAEATDSKASPEIRWASIGRVEVFEAAIQTIKRNLEVGR